MLEDSTKSIDIKGSGDNVIQSYMSLPEECNIPSKIFSRNKYGLINNHDVSYIYNEDGTINWRGMVKPQYLVPNRQKTQETDVSKLDDKDLLILLGGIKELAQIRGYTNVTYNVVAASDGYFATSCRITWIPNYETANREISFESLADASINNTKSFARYFLAAIAENRAFVRCVRNFLKINIVGQEELGDAKIIEENTFVENPTSPYNLLDKLMKEKNITFNILKNKLLKENIDGISSLRDIPKNKIFELIERIKKYDNSK
jgi:hypothetical protein